MNRKTKKEPSKPFSKGTHQNVGSFKRDRGRPTLHADGMLPPLGRVDHDDIDLMRVIKRTNALPLETLL